MSRSYRVRLAVLVVVALGLVVAGSALGGADSGASADSHTNTTSTVVETSTDTVIGGETVNVTVTLDTPSEFNAPAVDVDLPENWSVIEQSSSGTYRSSAVQWLWLRGGEKTVEYTVQVPENATRETYQVVTSGSAVNGSTGEVVVDESVTDISVVAPEPANFSVDVDTTNSPVTSGETLTVDALVTNDGGLSGTTDVNLFAGGAREATTTVTVGPGNSTSVALSWQTDSGDIGTDTARVTVDGANDTTTVAVEDGTAPSAVAGPNRTADEDTAIQFNGTDSADNVGTTSYEWAFGDGTTATGPTPTHTYANPGTYTVILTVTDAGGNTATDTLTVTVQDTTPPPAPADISVRPEAGGNVSVTFRDVDGGATAYSVRRATSTGGPFTEVVTRTDDGRDRYSVLDTGLEDGETYSYTVVTADESGNENASTAVSVTADATAPGVTDLALANPASQALTVTLSADEALKELAVRIDGPRSQTLTRSAFTETGTANGFEYATTLDVVPVGNYTATLIRATDDAGNDGASGQNASATVSVARSLAVAPTTHDFGALEPGDRATTTITVRNDGNASVSLTGVPVTGANDTAFTVTDAGASELAPGTSTNITVAFDATRPLGNQSARLQVQSANAPEIAVTLSGQVTVADATPSTATLPFFSVPVGGNATRTLAVTNDGGVPLTVGNATVTGPDAEAFGVTVENRSRTLDTSEGIDLGVRFDPTSAGAKTATLRVETDAPGDAVTVPLSGAGATRGINVTSGAVAFGGVPAGDLVTANVTVENDGFTSLSLSGASVTGNDSGAFTVLSGAQSEVVPGETHVVTVGFQPGSGGPASATLELRSDDPDDPTVAVPLEGQGTLPEAVVSTANLTYGGTPTNASTTRTVTVRNDGNATLVLDSPRVEGASPEAFAVVSSGGRTRLSPGERVAVTVAFTPPNATTHDATLLVPGDDPDGALSVRLSGPGERSNLSVSPASVAFDEVRVGERAQTEIDLRNTGGQPLNLTGIEIEGANASAFDLVSGTGEGTLAPGENRTLVAGFAPESRGARNAVVSVASNDPVTPVVEVSLGGRGVQPDISVSTAGLAYSETRVGGASERVVTVRNDGNANLSVTDAAVLGTGAANFERSGPGAFTLAPGESRNIPVAFTPGSAGDTSATLRIESNDPEEGTVTVDLSGRAVTPSVQVTPEAVVWDAVPVNTTVPLTVTVSNAENATATLPVTGVSVIGSDAEAFDAPGDGFTLAPNESRDLTVNFTPTTPGDNKSATLRLLTADPNQPQVDVWLTNGETVVDVDAVEGTDGDTEAAVNVNVTNARPNETVNANISQPDTREADVGIDEVGAAPTRRANFSLDVSISDEPFGRNFTRTDVADPVKFVRVEKTISDSDLDNVSFRFRVSKLQLKQANVTPAEMTLYRLNNGTWAELNVTVDRETRTHFIYQARGPGFSDFATGAKQPDFSIQEASLSVSAVRVGESVDILTSITNAEGAADGTFTVKLLLNGSVIENRVVTVPSGGLRQVVFDREFEDAGRFTVQVNNRTAGEISVEAAGDPGEGDQGAVFEVSGLDVSRGTVETGETVTVSATVRNTGTETGTYQAALLLNDVNVDRRNVTLSANESTTVSFNYAFDDPGEFEVTVGNATAATVTVEGAGTTSPFAVSEASLDPDTVVAGEAVTVQATVTNDRDEAVTGSVGLFVEGVRVASREVTLQANGSTTLTFTHTVREPGVFQLSVGNESAGAVQAEPRPTTTPTPTETTDTPDGGVSATPAILGGVFLVAILITAGLLWRRRGETTASDSEDEG